MKPISEKYPLLGYDFTDSNNYDSVYALAQEFVETVIRQKKSYAEACEAFNIAKKGLEGLRLID